MKILLYITLFVIIESCTTKKYVNTQLLPNGIQSASEEIYIIENNQKKLLQKKQMVFTRRGHIKKSKTSDSLGNVTQETEKRLWLIKESYPDKDPYYCKTRWKTKQRERISCYHKKQYKKNEAIYHYNKDGTINKIVDNFTTFHTQYYYYTNNNLSKIIIKDIDDNLIDEIQIKCITKDDKGACLKQFRVSKKSNNKKEILLFPKYQ